MVRALLQDDVLYQPPNSAIPNGHNVDCSATSFHCCAFWGTDSHPGHRFTGKRYNMACKGGQVLRRMG